MSIAQIDCDWIGPERSGVAAILACTRVECELVQSNVWCGLALARIGSIQWFPVIVAGGIHLVSVVERLESMRL